jgi:hypothetical protein
MNQTPPKKELTAETQAQPKPKLKLTLVKATVLEPRIAPALGPCS